MVAVELLKPETWVEVMKNKYEETMYDPVSDKY